MLIQESIVYLVSIPNIDQWNLKILYHLFLINFTSFLNKVLWSCLLNSDLVLLNNHHRRKRKLMTSNSRTEGVIYAIDGELAEQCLLELDAREKGVRFVMSLLDPLSIVSLFTCSFSHSSRRFISHCSKHRRDMHVILLMW